jgi:hypothetical protein
MLDAKLRGVRVFLVIVMVLVICPSRAAIGGRLRLVPLETPWDSCH